MPDGDDRGLGQDPPSTPVRRQIIMEPEAGGSLLFKDNKQTIPGLRLDYNRFDQVWQDELGTYVPRDNQPDDVHDDDPVTTVTDAVNQYAYSIVRHYKPSSTAKEDSVETWIHIWSPYWVKAAEKVMEGARFVDWTPAPLVFTPQIMLPFLGGFKKYLADLEADPSIPDAELIIEHVDFFIRFMRLEYHDKLCQLEGHLADGKIPWDMLWGLYIPGQKFRYYDVVVRQLHIARLVSVSIIKEPDANEEYWKLEYQYLECGTDGTVGWRDDWIRVDRYQDAVDIENLPAIPLDRVADAEQLKERLLARGKKWFKLTTGSHCMLYDGFGYRQDPSDNYKYTKTKIQSRLMIDRHMYSVYGGTVDAPSTTLDGQSMFLAVQAEASDKSEPKPERTPPPDETLVMAPAYIHGLALSSKEWLWFDAEYASEIPWNQEAFQNLSLPPDQKQLIKALVESHSSQTQPTDADDFTKSKGRGLIISLFGPPGVGKTLTAEATSELTHRPLYVVGAGEIGTSAFELESNLRRIFSTTSSWKAVVLIDEADIFLEKRSTASLDRNAIVAVLLRQLESFPGVLFLTTNRQIVFDEALLSRVHVSLHYPALTPIAKEQIWLAFLKRAKVDTEAWRSRGTIKRLRTLRVNGREIKNMVSTASVLARHKKEDLEEKHLWQVVSTNEKYGADAAKKNAARVVSRRRNLRIASALLVLAFVAVVLLRFFMTLR